MPPESWGKICDIFIWIKNQSAKTFTTPALSFNTSIYVSHSSLRFMFSNKNGSKGFVWIDDYIGYNILNNPLTEPIKSLQSILSKYKYFTDFKYIITEVQGLGYTVYASKTPRQVLSISVGHSNLVNIESWLYRSHLGLVIQFMYQKLPGKFCRIIESC